MNEHERILEVIRLKDQAPLTFDPHRSALLVIDVQRYFVSPDYPFAQVLERLVPGVTEGYFKRVRDVVLPNINKLLETYRAQQRPVIFTGTGSFSDDGVELPHWLKNFDQLGQAVLGKRIWPQVNDPSWQIDESVTPRKGELVLHKTSSGPLNSTKLDQLLHNMEINSLVVAGLTSDVCVSQTARETADRGFQVVVAEDACTTLSEEMHNAALLAFGLAFGRVRKSDEIVDLFSTDAKSREAAV
jgi:nicotinamidase-related amidase